VTQTRRWTVRVAVTLGALFALWVGICYQVVQNPRVVQHPTAADAIVVLGPATTSRTDAAVALMRQGLAHTLVISNAWTHQRASQLCDDPPTGWTLICFLPAPDTTRGEAEYVRGVARAHGWTSIIAVTSMYHISRASLILKRCLSGQLQMVAARESINPAQWLFQYAYQSGAYLRAALHTDC